MHHLVLLQQNQVLTHFFDECFHYIVILEKNRKDLPMVHYTCALPPAHLHFKKVLSQRRLTDLILIYHPQVFLVLNDDVQFHVMPGAYKFNILNSLDVFVVVELI